MKYLLTTAVGALFSAHLLRSYGFFGRPAPDLLARAGMLSDALFIPGVLIFGIGALAFLSRHGAFDAIAYSVKFVAGLARSRSPGERAEEYHEFKERMTERERPSFRFLLIIGAAFLMGAGVCTAFFLRLESGG